MHCLTRAAFRTLSTSAAPFLLKPRSITTVTPSALRTTRQIPNLAFQRRWSSDDSHKDQEAVYSSFSETSRSPGSSTGSERRSSRAGRNDERHAPKIFEPSENIFCGNLFFDITAEDLRNEMKRFGTVMSARVMYDQRGLSRGFGYVTFDSIDSASKAIDAMDGQLYEGRRIRVNYANAPPKSDFPTQPAGPPSKTLFLGNMSYEMTDADLNALFRDIRNVVDVRVAVDRRTGTPRGFSHVEFVDVESAQEGLEKLKGKAPYGRPLRIDYSMSNKTSSDRRQEDRESSEDSS